MQSNRVIVVGGGAAGCMAAGTAAENCAEVLLLEKNEKLCRKVMITPTLWKMCKRSFPMCRETGVSFTAPFPLFCRRIPWISSPITACR